MKKIIPFVLAVCCVFFSCKNDTFIDPIDDGIVELVGTTEGSTEDYECQFFQIAPNATIEELESFTINDDVDFVNIYTKGGRVDAYPTEMITLADLLESEDLDVSDLDFEYKEWVEIDNDKQNVAFQIKSNKIIE